MTIVHRKLGWWGRLVRAVGVGFARGVRRNGGGRRPPVRLQLEGLETRLTPSASTLTTLASFNTGGLGYIYPSSLVRDGSGNLFGTTVEGGTVSGTYSQGAGTIFEVPAGKHSITTLASFNGSNGAGPLAGLTLDSSGNLFGTTGQGGAGASSQNPYGFGTVFELPHGSHSITTLGSFNGTNGNGPQGTLVRDSSGDLFGTSFSGGAYNGGTIFEVKAGSHSITTLASLNANTNGFGPQGGMVRDSSGNLFGTTSVGGVHNGGIVFELAHGSQTITTLAAFNFTNGANPRTTLVQDSAGNIYGTTSSGGANQNGTIFEVPAGSHTITTLASFNGTNSNSAEAGVVLDSSGNLFGTTQYGGPINVGTVFELAKGSNSITTLASFNVTNGVTPLCGVVLDGNGDLFGTTNQGGTPGVGTVFELARAATSQSRNWAGYVVETNLASPKTGAVTAVGGSWKVPTVSGVAGASMDVWVGIDGDPVTNPTVEQVGTTAYLDSTTGKPMYYAWYEMYPGNEVRIPITIQAGDGISGSVTFNTTSKTFTMKLTDTTTGKTWSSTPLAAPVGVQRSSAEWIVEDTGAPTGSGLKPLANFGTVTFSNASATINGHSGAINDPAWQDQELNMFSSSGTIEAATSALTAGGTGFTVTY